MIYNSQVKDWLISFLLAVGFGVGLFMHGYNDVQYFPALVFLALAFLIGVLKSPLAMPSSGPAFCIILLWALYAVMFAFSTVPFISQIAFLVFCALPLAFFGANHGGLIKPLLILSAPIFAGLSAFAVYKNIFIPTGLFGSRAMWPFINPNSLATVLNIGLIAMSGAALGSDNKSTRKILTLLSLLIFAGLIATGSRGGLLAAVISLSILLLTARASLKPALPALGGGAVIALALPLISGSHLWENIGHLVASASSDPSITDRVSLWRSAWRMMMAHPLTGTGPGTFSTYYPAYREVMSDRSAGHFAHMDPLQMGVEMGVLAPILCYTLLIAVMIRTIRSLIAANDPGLRLRLVTPFAALLAVAIHAHICFPLYLMPILLACGVLLGVWHHATVDALGEGDDVIPLPRAAIMVIGGGMMAILLYLSGSSATGSYYLQKALAQKDTIAYLENLSRADRMGPDSFIDPEIEMARANIVMMEGGKITSVKLQERFLNETDILLNSAISWNPAWAEIDVLRGRLQKLQHHDSDAAISWNAALKKNPMHFGARRLLAEYLKESGNIAAAVTIVSEGLNYPHPMPYREWATTFLKNGSQQ